MKTINKNNLKIDNTNFTLLTQFYEAKEIYQD